MTKRRQGILYMLITVFIWGISFINIRVAMVATGAMTLGALRFLLATAILYAVMKWRKVDLRIKKKDIPLFLVSSGIGITLYFYFENNGVKYTSASVASIIIGAIPVFSVIADVLVYKRRVTRVTIFSVLLSLVGVGLIVGLSLKDLSSGGTLLGYLMMFGSVIAWIIYSISNKPLFERYNQSQITFYQSLFGLMFFLPFVPFETNHWEAMDAVVIGHIVCLAVFASALGFYLYLKGLDYLGISESAIYINLIPVVTVCFSFFWLGETLTPVQLIGGGIVLFSVYLMNFNQRTRLE